MTPSLAMTLLAQLTFAQPTITGVAPEPLSLEGTAQVVGTGFEADATTVTIGGVSQAVSTVLETQLFFTVASDTPLGSQTLTLETGAGTASADVEVAGRLPVIDDITPVPLVLGALGTVLGEALGTVTQVKVGDSSATITEQTDFVIVFEVPFEEELLGANEVSVIAPSGTARGDVLVEPPRPDIDAIAPNPARQGDLVTISGSITPLNVSAKIGLIDAPVIDVEPGAVTVLIPETVSIGPHDVTVAVGALNSGPEGPLYVQRADVQRPSVHGVYPVNVAQGGDVWVVGENLTTLDSATHGLSIVDCEPRACRLSTADTAVGQSFTAAVDGTAGAATFTMAVTEQTPVVPRIEGSSPAPAFRGQELTITGQDFATTKAVVIGGQAQSIDFFDGTTIRVTVHEATPLGAETIFVAGTAGSEPAVITVLDPLPDGTITGGDDVVGGDAGSAADVGGGGGDGGGCSGAGSGPASSLVLLCGMLFSAWLGARRRSH